jgi:hypothetical protein
MGDGEASRQELENQLRERVANAKVRLDLARNYVREVQRDLKSGTITESDGHHAHQYALQAETLALQHYQSVLNTLSTLVLTGKIPDEQDGP